MIIGKVMTLNMGTVVLEKLIKGESSLPSLSWDNHILKEAS